MARREMERFIVAEFPEFKAFFVAMFLKLCRKRNKS